MTQPFPLAPSLWAAPAATPPLGATFLQQVVLAANTGVFYVVKAAMEHSKSPRTPPQIAVGFLCNFFRRMNNVHPLVPLAFVAAIAAALGRTIGSLLG